MHRNHASIGPTRLPLLVKETTAKFRSKESIVNRRKTPDERNGWLHLCFRSQDFRHSSQVVRDVGELLIALSFFLWVARGCAMGLFAM